MTAAGAAQAEDTLDRLLGATALRDGYAAPRASEVERAEELFLQLMKGERGAALEEGFRAVDFSLGTLELSGETLAVVREAPGAATGKGLFVVRAPGPAIAPVALQAPHRFMDLDTGTIVARLFAEDPRFAAAAWNTLPRRYDDTSGQRVESDLAHAPVSHLNAFTRAFARAHEGGLVAQVHGFEQGRRNSPVGASADVIVSGGTTSPGQQVRARTACLRNAPERWKVLLFPVDVRELGATTNTNAAALRALGGPTEFLHLELSRELRRRLARDAAPRQRLADCLIGGAR